MRKGRMFAVAGRPGERNGKSMGCRELGPMMETGQAPGLVLLFRVMLTWDCAMMPLCSFSCHSLCSSLLFREAIGGAITSKADTTAILSTPCPLHIRFVILQQGQGISSDRCLRVLRVLTRSNLSMGFYFTA